MSDKGVKILTPVGPLSWVQITGQGKLNYNEDGYNYVATLTLDEETAKPLIAQIDEIAKGCPADKKFKSNGYRPVFLDKDDKQFVETDNRVFDEKNGDKKTNLLAFSFATRTKYDDGKPTIINVYNAKGVKVVLGDRLIGNGTIGSISGKGKVYVNGKNTGVSLYLKAVQVVKYVPYDGDAGFAAVEADDAFMGFDEADDDFQKPEAEAPAADAGEEKKEG
jgi:hypothetical protein